MDDIRDANWPVQLTSSPDPYNSRHSCRLGGLFRGGEPEEWPEQIRPAVAFAMGMLTELEEHDAGRT